MSEDHNIDPIEGQNKKDVFTPVIVSLIRERIVSVFKMFWIYLKTTGYVIVKPVILIDDIEDPGLNDHVEYSASTFAATALIMIGFGLFGVETHNSWQEVHLEHGKCLSGDCENDFGKKINGDTTYTGFFKNGLPSGVGVLHIVDSVKLVSKFHSGSVIGTGFADYDGIQGYESIVMDGEKADSAWLSHLKPLIALIYYFFSLWIYVILLRNFKNIYQGMPDSYITKAAIFHFNMVFFSLIIILMITLTVGDVAADTVVGLMIPFAMFLHPIYFFYSLGKLKHRVKSLFKIALLSVISFIFNFINGIILAMMFFDDSVVFGY